MAVPSKKIKFIILYSVIALALLCFAIFMFLGRGDSKKTKIFVLFHKSEVDGPFHELINLYNSTHPDVKVEGQTSGGGGDYESVLQTKLSNNSVHLINYEGFGNMKKLEGKLLNLSDMELVKNLKEKEPSLFDACVNEKGEILGFPVAIEACGTMVNKPIFEAAGVDVKSIKTFDQFKQACEPLKAAIEQGKLKSKYPNLQTVYMIWGKDPWSLTNHFGHQIVSRDFKNSIEAYNSPTFQFSAAGDYRKLIDFKANMSVEGAPTKEKLASLNTIDYSTAFDGYFLNEKCAVCDVGTWAVPAIEKYDSENKTNRMENMELLPMFFPSDDDSKIMILVGQCWGINSSSSEKEIKACKDFLNWMYTDSAAKAIVKDKMRMVSPFITKEELAGMQWDKITKSVLDAYVKHDYKLVGGSIALVRTEDWNLKNNGTAIQERFAGKISDAEFDKRIRDGWAQKFKTQNTGSSQQNVRAG